MQCGFHVLFRGGAVVWNGKDTKITHEITIYSNLIGPQTCILFYFRYNKTNYGWFSISSKGTDNCNKTPETIKKHHHVKNLEKK